MRNRSRHALLLLALTLLLPACGDDGGAGTAPEGDGETAGGGELTTLRVATIPIADLGAYFYAIDQGIFTEHGLDVQNTEAAGGAAAISAMVGGEVDLAYTNNVSVLQTAVEGLPIRIACGANENVPEGESDMAAFVASPDVTSPEDLVGGTVATNALNNINHLYARVFLRENGFDPDEVDYVEVPFPEQPAALLEGRIQGTLIPEPFKTQLLEEGATNLGFAYRVGEDDRTAIASFVATPQFAQENADAVQRFCEALGAAIEEIEQEDNRDAFLDAVANNTALERDQIEEITLSTYTTDVPREELEEMAQYMVEEGLIEEVPDIDALLAGR